MSTTSLDSAWVDNYVELDLEVVSLGELRATVRRMLDDCSDEVGDDAVQVCDELASNALRHARPSRTCRLLTTRHGRLRVEVDDGSPRRPRIRRPDRSGGRGLILVDQLATSWGVDYHTDSKTVWAELATRDAA